MPKTSIKTNASIQVMTLAILEYRTRVLGIRVGVSYLIKFDVGGATLGGRGVVGSTLGVA